MRLHFTCVERRILDEIASSICARAAPACDVRSAPNRTDRRDYGADIPTPGKLHRDAECKYRRRWLASPVVESSRRSPSSLSPATIMTWTPTICSRYIGPNSIDQAVAIAGTSMYGLRQQSWRTKRPCYNCLATEFLASVHLPELSKRRGSLGTPSSAIRAIATVRLTPTSLRCTCILMPAPCPHSRPGLRIEWNVRYRLMSNPLPVSL
jgi:hypothetical protein